MGHNYHKLTYGLTFLLMMAVVPIRAQEVASTLYNTLSGNPPQNRTVSVIDVLTKLEDKHDVIFDYDADRIRGLSLESEILHTVEQYQDVRTILDSFLPALKLRYERYSENSFLIYPIDRPLEQLKPKEVKPSESNEERKSVINGIQTTSTVLKMNDVTVEGTVTGKDDGEAIPGVNVVERGTNNGTITDVDGNYSIEVSDGATLIFSSVGYATQQVEVGNRTTINVVLSQNVQELEELVVVGYGEQRKGETTVALSQVKSEEIESIPTTSVAEVLGGRAAGVDVVTGSGAPGAQSKIRIRGANSINSSAEPLIVIDGFPVAAEESDLFSSSRMGISGESTDLLSMINPNDIASIEILKDAAAKSIYGARGANGVILITTKSGRSGRSGVNLTAKTGVHQVANKWDLMNANQFSELLYDAYSRGGVDMQNLAYDPDQRLAIPTEYNTNWLDQVLRTGSIQDYNLSFSGGNDKSSYSGSVGYLNNQGIIKSNYYNRYSARLKGQSSAWNDRITFGANANFSYVDQKTISSDRVFNRAMAMPPNYPVYFPDGTEFAGFLTHSGVRQAFDVIWGNSYGVASSDAMNSASPLLDVQQARAPTNMTRIILNGFGSIELMDGLTFKTSVGTDLNYSKMKFLIQSEGPFRPTGASLEHRQNQTNSWLIENTLNYQKEIGDHSFNLLLGQSAQQFYGEGLGIAVEEADPGNILIGNNPFFVDGFSFNNGVHDRLTDSHKFASVNEWTVGSYFGRFNYSYQDRYLLTATLRRDGSSRFGEDNKWGNFPGVSAAWNLHNENFFNVSNVNQLKLRGSWGVVGNQNIGNFLSKALLTSTPSQVVGVVVAGTSTREQGLVDSGLSWESTREVNVGVDAFLYNRISVTSDVFWKKTFDLLYGFALPESTGFSTISTTNLGSLNQFGVELSVGGDIIRKANGFRWNGNINLTHIRGRVTELPPDTPWVGDKIRSYLDEPIGTIYGYEVDGIYNSVAEVESADNPYPAAQPGDYRYRDLGGTNDEGEFVLEPDGNITGADRVNLGNVMPWAIIGFNNTFSYKNFSLNLFFRSSIGYKIYNEARRNLLDTDGDQNTITAALDRWTPENQNQTIQAANSNRNDPTGDNPISTFVEDGSYLRLNNLTFSYTLPEAVLNNIGIGSLRVYTTLNNVFVLTNYSGLDPEIEGGDVLVPRGIDTGTYPRTRTYSLGLDVRF